MLSIDEWADAHRDPALALAERPDLIAQCARGRQLGLRWPQIAEWLLTQGVTVPWRSIEAVVRRAR